MPSWRSAAINLRQVVAVALDVRFRQTCDRRGGPAVRVDLPAPEPGLDAPGNHSLEKGANAIDDPQFESRLFDSSWRHRQRVQRRRFYVAGRYAVDERGNRPGHRGDLRHAQGRGANGLPGVRGVEHLVGLRAGPRVQLRAPTGAGIRIPRAPAARTSPTRRSRRRSACRQSGPVPGNPARSGPTCGSAHGECLACRWRRARTGSRRCTPPTSARRRRCNRRAARQLERSREYQERQQATRDLRSCRHQNWA